MLKDRIRRRLYRYLETAKDRLFKVRFIVSWFVWEKYCYSKTLYRRFNIRDIKPYHFRGWHGGTSAFVGMQDGKKVFIKRSILKEAIDSEVSNIQLLKESGSKACFETCEILGTIQLGHQHIVIESFIEGVPFSQALKTMSNEEISDVLLRLCDVIAFFGRIRFIHCDFTPGNIFLSQNGLYIIDFEFGTFADRPTQNKRLLSLPREKVNGLGGIYSLRNGLIDDSYSLVQMINHHCPSFSISHRDKWISLNLNILNNSIEPATIRK